MKFLSLDTYNITPNAHIFIEFLRTVAYYSVALFLLIVLMNYIVDPYAIYDTPRLVGFNANKPLLYKHLRLAKAHAVVYKQPDALIIGSSRTEHGLDPEHPAIQARYNSYNLALTGATIYENLRYLQHANTSHPLKMVVLAVDLFQFNAYRPNASDFSEERLLADFEGKEQAVSLTIDKLATLASVDAMMASLQTIFGQENNDNVILLSGQAKPIQGDSLALKNRGRREAALYSELNFISHLYFPKPFRKFGFISKDGSVNTFNYFRKILEYCHHNNIRLHILISPAHARQWELVTAAGMWFQFEQWKREMVSLNQAVATEMHVQPFPLWDFSGFNYYTTETFPNLGDKQMMMEWYWESSHYRVELGNRVLDRIFDYREPNRQIANDFGVMITPDNIDEHLSGIRKKRHQYEINHADEVAEIYELVRNFRSQ
ncbi:MAG: hypothetical protein ACU833_06630 [Gammaproteobacteria bacterium]